MALQRCSECGRDVSTKAKTCPNCGAPVRAKSGCLKFGCLTILILLGLLIWAGIEGDKYAKTPEGRAATTQRQADEAREQMLKNAERNQLAEQQPAKVPVEHKWYEGGTLHRKTISDWRAASYSDRLATSADFVTGAASIRGKTYTSMDEVKQQTVELEHAISTVADGGNADNQKVSEVAAMLYTIQDKR